MADQTEILIAMYELKIHTLNVYATTGMTWWVSSIVFCGTILGGAWVKKDELEKFPLFNFLGWFLTYFFFSIAAFGVWVIFGLQRLSYEIDKIQGALNIPSELSNHFTILTYQVAYGLGTTSFVVILALWVKLWKYIAREKGI